MGNFHNTYFIYFLLSPHLPRQSRFISSHPWYFPKLSRSRYVHKRAAEPSSLGANQLIGLVAAWLN